MTARQTLLRIVRDPETPDEQLRAYWKAQRRDLYRAPLGWDWQRVAAWLAALLLAVSCWIGWGDILAAMWRAVR